MHKIKIAPQAALAALWPVYSSPFTGDALGTCWLPPPAMTPWVRWVSQGQALHEQAFQGKAASAEAVRGK